MSDTKFTRPLHLCEQVVILDGLTGTGKTMFSPLLSSFDRVQNARFEYMLEFLCIAAGNGKLAPDAASTMLNLLADIKCYDGVISREVNFRFTDLSSVFKSSRTWQYVRQLGMPDGASAGERIRRDKPILFFVTHQILSQVSAARAAFGDRLRVVQMVRHPLYLLDHWDSYIAMHGSSPRDFAMWIEHDGRSLPWFTAGWEEKYSSASQFDQVIYSIGQLMEQVFAAARTDDPKVAFVPFESFVLSPEAHLVRMEQLLGTTRTSGTAKVLRSQRVPRPFINAGPQKSIYKRYGLQKHLKNISHEADYARRLDIAKQRSSADAFASLEATGKKYEDTFGRWF